MLQFRVNLAKKTKQKQAKTKVKIQKIDKNKKGHKCSKGISRI